MIDYRLKLEKHLRRKLRSNEIVHHIDGDSLNNRLSNLQIVSRTEHITIHRNIKRKSNWKKNTKIYKDNKQSFQLSDFENSIDLLFSDYQKEIIFKRLLNKECSKVDNETYSRCIKKKLKAIINNDIQDICKSLL